MPLRKLACSYKAYMQLHNLACSYISWHAVHWASYMQFPELSWSSMSLHEVPWACMQFHELVCCSFLCLSSSQEFRSACCDVYSFILKVRPHKIMWKISVGTTAQASTYFYKTLSYHEMFLWYHVLTLAA